jgi:GNAT superfamily N-acetyltransferase
MCRVAPPAPGVSAVTAATRAPRDDPGSGFVAADVPWLSIGVVAPWRGRGVGRALPREVLAVGAERGSSRVSLSAERANRARARSLAEGFVIAEAGPDADPMVQG